LIDGFIRFLKLSAPTRNAVNEIGI